MAEAISSGGAPDDFVIDFEEALELPAPVPHIRPGWGITGKRVYLETGGTTRAVFTEDTPFGGLVVSATGRYFVEWGDGTVSGPHDREGGPWPSGEITHVYSRAGSYDVVVREEWRANWLLGSESGVLTGMVTVATIEGFPVRELQAVRRR